MSAEEKQITVLLKLFQKLFVIISTLPYSKLLIMWTFNFQTPCRLKLKPEPSKTSNQAREEEGGTYKKKRPRGKEHEDVCQKSSPNFWPFYFSTISQLPKNEERKIELRKHTKKKKNSVLLRAGLGSNNNVKLQLEIVHNASL